MKQTISRRKFAQMASAAVALAPAGWSTVAAADQSSAQQPSAQDAPPKPKYGMTAEQEKQVSEAIARRERQTAGFRARTLPYALEPAFVFRVKKRTS